MKQLSILAALLFAHALPAGIAVAQDGVGLRVLINGKLFTEYGNDRHVPYLYPLMSPDGTHLTRRFPFEKGVAGEASDHPHHIGFWFAHGNVNGHDFWHGDRGEEIVTTRLHHEAPEKHPGGTSVRFTANLEWRAKGRKILAEKRVYTITEMGTSRIIDVRCRLKAGEAAVTFRDTKEGSFALRLAPTMRLKGKAAQGGITNSKGIEGGKAWGKRARWVAYHGPDSRGTNTVATIFDHPDNLRHPTWWHARDYGLLTANPFGPSAYGDKDFPGNGDFRLEEGETLTLKYRLLLHQGDLAPAKLDEKWAAFAEPG